MLTAVTAVVALGAWIVVIAKVGMLRRGAHDRRVLSLWGFFALFAISSTLHLEPLQRLLDRALGAGGLTMFVASTLLVLAFYLLCTSCDLAITSRSPRWMPFYLVATIGLLTGLFVLGPDADSSEGLLSLTIKYAFGIAMFSRVVVLLGPSCRTERTETVRVRICLVCLAALLVIGFLILQPCAGWLNLAGVPQQLVDALEALALVSLIGAGIAWPLGFAPNPLLARLAQPLLVYEKRVALRDLQRLGREIHRLCPAVARSRSPERSLAPDVDLRLYQTVIAILDSRNAFAHWLADQAAEEAPPSRERAVWLSHALQGISDAPFDSLVRVLRQIAKECR